MTAFFPGVILLAVLAVVVIWGIVIAVGSLRKIQLGHVTLSCPHCGKETTSHLGTCQHCGEEL